MVSSSWLLSVKTQQDWLRPSQDDCGMWGPKMIVVCGVLGGSGDGAAAASLLSNFQTHLEGLHVAYPPATVAEMVFWGGLWHGKKLIEWKRFVLDTTIRFHCGLSFYGSLDSQRKRIARKVLFCTFFQGAAIISFIWRCHFHKAVLSQLVQGYIPDSANLQAAQKHKVFQMGLLVHLTVKYIAEVRSAFSIPPSISRSTLGIRCILKSAHALFAAVAISHPSWSWKSWDPLQWFC